MLAPVTPLARVEGRRLLPGARRDRWTLFEGLLLLAIADRLGFVLLAASTPLFQVREEGARRTKCRIDGGAAKHRRDIWRDNSEWHDGRSMLLRRMGKMLQGSQRFLVIQVEYLLMGLDDFKVEGDDTVEESLICRKAFNML